jgi:hypothetical protein
MIDFRFLYLKKSIKYPVNLAIERSYDNTNYRFCQRKVNGKFFLLVFIHFIFSPLFL